MRHIRKCLIVGSLAMCLGLVPEPANADMAVLTFDDIYTYATDSKPVPNGYGGFSWNNLNVVNGAFSPDGPYDWARVSGDYTAFNPNGAPAGMSAVSWPTFDFDGVYLTPCWYIRDLRVVGYLAGAIKYDTTVSFTSYVTPPPPLPSPPTSPQWFDFDYMGIDQLAFTPSGGWPLGGWFVMDDLTYRMPAAVPLPGAVLLGLLGLGTAGWKLRKHA